MSGQHSYNSKVARLMEEYDLSIDLPALWTGEDGERWSLRELADEFNIRLVSAELEAHDVMTSQSDAEHVYHVLTGESREGDKIQKRRELQREGIDVEALESNFVSHQAIHSYLTKVADTTYSDRDGDEQVNNAIDSLNKLQNRTRAVSQNTIDRLAKSGQIEVGSVDVFVDVYAYCNECGTDMPVTDLLNDRGCGCTND